MSIMKKFLVRNNMKAVLALCRDWGCITMIVILNISYPSVYLYIISVWVIGAFQFALGEAMMHEAAHHNLFSRKWLNYGLEFLYGYPFFRTVQHFRQEHFVHHNRLGTERDHLTRDYRNFGLLGKRPRLFFSWFVKPIIGYAALYYIRTMQLNLLKRGTWKIAVFWVLIVAIFFVFADPLWIVKFWLVPLLWSSYSYLYWSEITDHYNTTSGTRSNINPIYNFLTHNNGYHYIHHKYPTIPWFNLKKSYHELAPNEGDVSKGFWQTFSQISRNRQG